VNVDFRSYRYLLPSGVVEGYASSFLSRPHSIA
jgi:hypothetical protein